MENVCRNYMYSYNLVISCDAPVNKSVPTYVCVCVCGFMYVLYKFARPMT